MEETVTTSVYVLDGVTFDYGLTPVDIFTNGMTLVGSVAAFVVLGIAIAYVPKLISIIKGAVS